MEIVDSEHPLGVNELARRTRLAKGTVSRLLGTMVEDGYLTCGELDGLYSAGREIVWRLAGPSLHSDLRRAIREAMTRLRDASGETVALYVPVWPERVCIEQVESRSGLRRIHEPGERWSLSSGSAGRAYLAYVSEQEVARTLAARPLVAVTPHSITDPELFRAALAEIRRDGYSVAFSERFDGMSGMAAPIFLHGREAPAAMISIAGPQVRWHREAMSAFAPLLLETVRSLSNFGSDEVAKEPA